MNCRQEDLLGSIASSQLRMMRALRDLAMAVEAGQYVPQARCNARVREVVREMEGGISHLSAAMIECEREEG